VSLDKQLRIVKEPMNLHSPSINKWMRLLAPGAIVSIHSWAVVSTGKVFGSVVDDSGNPIARARVFINSAPPATAPQFSTPPVVTGKQVAMVASDPSGAFSVGNLPPGQYIACAEAPIQGLLDPCLWATSAPTFTVTAGQSTSAVNVVLARGAILPIHIDDPMALLTPVTAPVDFKLQVHIVTSKGLRYMARIQSSTAGSRNLAMTIPFGTHRYGAGAQRQPDRKQHPSGRARHGRHGVCRHLGSDHKLRGRGPELDGEPSRFSVHNPKKYF
jgi:hypothetical protein